MNSPFGALSPIVPLAPTHKVGAFVCGDSAVDRFLRSSAASEQALRLSQVYVSVTVDNDVAAFFTLSPITVRVEPALLAKIGTDNVPNPSIGGFLLGRLGVHTSLQRRGIGEALVMRAAQIAKQEAEVVGGVFLAVDPKTERLADWYRTQGFHRLGATSRRLVLPFTAFPSA